MYKLSPEQKEVVRVQQKNRRAAARIVRDNLIAQRNLKLSQGELEKRKADRVDGRPDMRRKENRLKPNRVPAPKTIPKETRLPQSPKQTALRKERKPRAQAAVCKIPTQDPTTIKTWIPELKMHVFLRPGQSAASVVAKYASRPGAKIGKF